MPSEFDALVYMPLTFRAASDSGPYVALSAAGENRWEWYPDWEPAGAIAPAGGRKLELPPAPRADLARAPPLPGLKPLVTPPPSRCGDAELGRLFPKDRGSRALGLSMFGFGCFEGGQVRVGGAYSDESGIRGAGKGKFRVRNNKEGRGGGGHRNFGPGRLVQVLHIAGWRNSGPYKRMGLKTNPP